MPLSIKARCFNGKAYELTLDGDAPTVRDLQQKISEASGITADRQTILYKGQVLDTGKLSEFSLTDGGSISVVRRIGKSSTSSTSSSAPPTKSTTTNASTPSTTTKTRTVNDTPATTVEDSGDGGGGNTGIADGDHDGSPQPPTLEDMMRSLNMAGAGAGGGGLPGGGLPGGAGAGGGLASMFAREGDGGQPPNMEALFSQLPQLMNGFLNTPLFKDYLNNTEKQEQSREAILNNPLMRSVLESDPEFARVVNDPDQWRASMEAARHLFNNEQRAAAGGGAESGGSGEGGENEDESGMGIGGASAAAGLGGSGGPNALNVSAKSATAPSATESKLKSGTLAASRQSAAELAPQGIDVKKLSESYGHALGQSLINSGLGLDTDLVVKGLKSAVQGQAFPMSLPEYERNMAQLQNIASEFLKKANLEDANQFFEELKSEGSATMVEDGKIAYEKSEVETSENGTVAKEKATVLVIVSARLLDGRHFFTCPAADDKGESVHPLTLPLDTAPPALAKGIIGMKENESRLLYVHPSACEGMADMFGDLLPPNALLIFDLQLVSADAPDEEQETVGESYFSG